MTNLWNQFTAGKKLTCFLPAWVGPWKCWEWKCWRGNTGVKMLPSASGNILSPRSQFLPIRTDPSRQITCLFFSCSKLVLEITQMGFEPTTLTEGRGFKSHLGLGFFPSSPNMYFMLLEFISPVNFSKNVFPVWNFVRSLKFYYKNNTVIAIKITWNQIFVP